MRDDEIRAQRCRQAGRKALCPFLLDEVAAQNPAWRKEDEALLAGAFLKLPAAHLALRLSPLADGILVGLARKHLPGLKSAFIEAAQGDCGLLLSHLGFGRGREPKSAKTWQRTTCIHHAPDAKPWIEVYKVFPASFLIDLWNIPWDRAAAVIQKAEKAEMDRLEARSLLWRAGVLKRCRASLPPPIPARIDPGVSTGGF